MVQMFLLITEWIKWFFLFVLTKQENEDLTAGILFYLSCCNIVRHSCIIVNKA